MRNDNLADMFYLKDNPNNGHRRAMGVVHNRTVNVFTARDQSLDPNSSCAKKEVLWANSQPVYLQAQQINHESGVFNNNRLRLSDMGSVKHYHIDFFNPQFDSYLYSVDKWSNPFGELTVEYPPLYATREQSIIYFKAHEYNGPSFSQTPIQEDDDYLLLEIQENHEVSESAVQEDPESPESQHIENAMGEFVVPNPSKTSCQVFFDPIMNVSKIEVFDSFGSLVLEIDNPKSGEELNATNWAPGIYVIHLNGIQRNSVLKFVKQ